MKTRDSLRSGGRLWAST